MNLTTNLTMVLLTYIIYDMEAALEDVVEDLDISLKEVLRRKRRLIELC